jgi:hypothetical protein
MSMAQVIEISKSDLAGARDTGNREFIETNFKKAEEVIKAGGSVHLMQVYSDSSKEVADIIDNLDQLAHLKTIYLR